MTHKKDVGEFLLERENGSLLDPLQRALKENHVRNRFCRRYERHPAENVGEKKEKDANSSAR